MAWAKNDTIGIFPSKGGQVEFPIEEGTGSKQALFDGGDWALKAGRAYAAYYPFNRWNTFRDSNNDKQMILLAGIGVAMGNADDDIKQVADFITLDNNSDGVAYALKHFGLIQD